MRFKIRVKGGRERLSPSITHTFKRSHSPPYHIHFLSQESPLKNTHTKETQSYPP